MSPTLLYGSKNPNRLGIPIPTSFGVSICVILHTVILEWTLKQQGMKFKRWKRYPRVWHCCPSRNQNICVGFFLSRPSSCYISKWLKSHKFELIRDNFWIISKGMVKDISNKFVNPQCQIARAYGHCINWLWQTYIAVRVKDRNSKE